MLFCCNILFADQTPQLLEEERMAGGIQLSCESNTFLKLC